jgi:hypothetical protein
MGTSCHIAYQCLDGSTRGCYVHFDGYPENMIPSIQAFLARSTTTCLMLHIKKAQAKGGLRYFNYNGDTNHSSFSIELLENGEPWEINDDDFGTGTSYRYLISMRTGSLLAEAFNSETNSFCPVELTGGLNEPSAGWRFKEEDSPTSNRALRVRP